MDRMVHNNHQKKAQMQFRSSVDQVPANINGWG